jgi:hypothetical protein
MKLNQLITMNAILFIGLGIAFALYGPLMIAMFGILETEGSSLIYWYAASFARLMGAALFGFGFVLWALRGQVGDQSISGQGRGLILALVISNALGLVVAITQQVSIWGKPAGWITSALFLALLVCYSFLLVKKPA